MNKSDLFKVENTAIQHEIRKLLLSRDRMAYKSESFSNKDLFSEENQANGSVSIDKQTDKTERAIFDRDYLAMDSNDEITCVIIKEENDETSLEDIQCDNCGNLVTGFRYCCVQCSKYELCVDCERSGAHQHHYVLRVPEYRLDGEINTVLERIRNLMTEIVASTDVNIGAENRIDSGAESKLEVLPKIDPSIPPLQPYMIFKDDDEGGEMSDRKDLVTSAHSESNSPGPGFSSLVSTPASDVRLSSSSPVRDKTNDRNCTDLSRSNCSTASPKKSPLRKRRRLAKYLRTLPKSNDDDGARGGQLKKSGDVLGKPFGYVEDKQNGQKRTKKTLRKVAEDYIKKPLNAFMIYLKDTRVSVKNEYPRNEQPQSAVVNKIIAERWNRLGAVEKKKYFEKARIEKQRHILLHPEYKPNRMIRKKKPKRKIELAGMTNKRCRALYGFEAIEKWCIHCRRKKKCQRNVETQAAKKKCLSYLVFQNEADQDVKIEILSNNDDDDMSLSMPESSTAEPILRSAVNGIVNLASNSFNPVMNQATNSPDPVVNQAIESIIDPATNSAHLVINRATISIVDPTTSPADPGIAQTMRHIVETVTDPVRSVNNVIKSSMNSVEPVMIDASNSVDCANTTNSVDPVVNKVTNPVEPNSIIESVMNKAIDYDDRTVTAGIKLEQ